MALQDIKDELDNLKENSEEFIHASMDYYKLLGFKITVKAGAIFMTLLLVSLPLMMCLLFISFFAAYAIGSLMGNIAYGFLFVAGFYLIVTLITFMLRKTIVEKPLIQKLSEIIFND